ncbi:MAG: hypothetical protein PHR06_10180 [Candidatus Cloacimonetes bacterium]|nr:hypothetical protein [Candidatus Cloacimonadota bacterium]
MKKSYFLIILLFAGLLLAVESEPSEIVGYVKISAGVGYTAFAVPFTVYDSGVETLAISDIIGDQLTGGLAYQSDRILDITNGTVAWLNNTGVWQGFTEFTQGHAYYIHNRHTAKDIFLSGSVIENSHNYGIISIGYTAFSINSVYAHSLDDIDLISSGLTGGLAYQSDRILDITNGTVAWLNSSGVWQGFSTLTIGHAYYIHNRHSEFTWIYNPNERNKMNVTEFIHNKGDSK